jgi:hypothetical protein
MTRPLRVATLAALASLSAVFLSAPAQAGGPPPIMPHGQLAGQLGLPAAPPVISGVTLAPPRFHRGFGQRSIYDSPGAFYRYLSTGDFRYGRFYDAYLTRYYGGEGGGNIYSGPQIITLTAAPAAQQTDPPVIAAPREAYAPRAHGVRVIYLTDPPAEFQRQLGQGGRRRGGY